jgi:hypothetical protein
METERHVPLHHPMAELPSDHDRSGLIRLSDSAQFQSRTISRRPVCTRHVRAVRLGASIRGWAVLPIGPIRLCVTRTEVLRLGP